MYSLLQNKMNINDWHSIQTLWDKLHKQLDKTKKVTGMLGTPRPYVKIITELEDFLAKTLNGTCQLFIGRLEGLSAVDVAARKFRFDTAFWCRVRVVKEEDSNSTVVAFEQPIRSI